MRAPHLALTFLLLLTPVAAADPVKITEKDGSPAVKSDGSSSTTVSAAGGAVRVTVEGGGSLSVHTHSGTVSGEGNAGGPQLGVATGGGFQTGSLANPQSSPDAGDRPKGHDDSPGSDVSTGAGDAVTRTGAARNEDGNPGEGNIVHTDEVNVPARVEASSDVCAAALPHNDATMLSIALVRNPAGIEIVEVCDSRSRLSSQLLGAVDKNDILVTALGTAGYDTSSLVAVDVEGRGRVVLFVAKQ